MPRRHNRQEGSHGYLLYILRNRQPSENHDDMHTDARGRRAVLFNRNYAEGTAMGIVCTSEVRERRAATLRNERYSLYDTLM